MSLVRESFQRLHYPVDIILLCVRWYLSYALSLRNLEEMMYERGIRVDHSTIHRWILRLSAQLTKRVHRGKSKAGLSWKMDETYIKVKGRWCYLYRAVDSKGNTIDFFFSDRRDKKSALRFFSKAFSTNDLPQKINIDKRGANLSALNQLNSYFKHPIKITQIKYCNNRVEQDHRFIKKRIRYMLVFKSFETANTILSALESIHMINKGQIPVDGKRLHPVETFYKITA